MTLHALTNNFEELIVRLAVYDDTLNICYKSILQMLLSRPDWLLYSLFILRYIDVE